MLFLNGKKIDSLLKSFVTSRYGCFLNLGSYNNRGRDLVNLTKLKSFIKSEKNKLKKHAYGQSEHKEYEDRPIFTRLMAENSYKVLVPVNV